MFDDNVEQMLYTDNILNFVKYRLHVWIRERVDEVEEQGGQGRRGVLRTSSGQDRRPKCQPVGAQIDCRWGAEMQATGEWEEGFFEFVVLDPKGIGLRTRPAWDKVIILYFVCH